MGKRNEDAPQGETTERNPARWIEVQRIARVIAEGRNPPNGVESALCWAVTQLRERALVHPDTARLDWMDEHLRRDAEVVEDGRTVRTSHAWAIVGEFDTLRETVDLLIKASPAPGGDGHHG